MQLFVGSREVGYLLMTPKGCCSLVTFWRQQDDSLRVTVPTLLGLLVAGRTPHSKHQTTQMNVFFYYRDGLKYYLFFFMIIKVTHVLRCGFDGNPPFPLSPDG